MSRFLYHESCPQCGSKDNLGVWDDGHKFCFGCKYHEQGAISIHRVFNSQLEREQSPKEFPYDASENMPFEPLRWLLKNGITFQLQKEHGIMWSHYRQMVCWQIKGLKGTIIGWQGRCFAPDAKMKYYSQGRIREDVCVVARQSPLPDTVVLVEDYISAVRVSGYLPCIPLFGCVCSLEALGQLLGRFKNIKVWLDSDKLDNARQVAQNASMLGLKSDVVFTPQDPKEYSNREIAKFLEVSNV